MIKDKAVFFGRATKVPRLDAGKKLRRSRSRSASAWARAVPAVAVYASGFLRRGRVILQAPRPRRRLRIAQLATEARSSVRTPSAARRFRLSSNWSAYARSS